MSLRHLYKDLDSLGVHPDLIVSIGNAPAGDYKLVLSSFNKYYGPKLDRDSTVTFNDRIVASIIPSRNGPFQLDIRDNICIIYKVFPMVRFNDDIRDIDWNYCPPSLDMMLLVRYREITDIDSLYNVVKSIVR